MLPVIAGIVTGLPALIGLAEKIFPGKGEGNSKHAMVKAAVAAIYDTAGARIMPDWKGVDERRLVLRICDVLIEELVPAVTGKASDGA